MRTLTSAVYTPRTAVFEGEGYSGHVHIELVWTARLKYSYEITKDGRSLTGLVPSQPAHGLIHLLPPAEWERFEAWWAANEAEAPDEFFELFNEEAA